MSKIFVVTSLAVLILLVTGIILIVINPFSTSNNSNANCANFDLQLMTKITETPKVVIIGAGPAGLAAASKLIQFGFHDVSILEASNRTGGRVHSSSEFLEHHGYVELGAQFIHGEVGNVVYKLAKDSGFVKLSGSEIESTIPINKDEGYLDEKIEEEVWELYDKMWDDIQQNANLSNQSVGVYADAKFDELKQTVPDYLKEYIPLLKDLCHRGIQNDDGCRNWYDLSYENEYEECEGNQQGTFKKGIKYEDVLQIFKNDISDDKFFFNTSVTKIDYTDHDNIKILSQDGKTFLADIVIFTGSLGVLKSKGRDIFQPQLPNDKLKAIDTIGFGTVDKIYLEFSELVFEYNWEPLFDDDGILYSTTDAANDWTRFLTGSYMIDEKLASFWPTGEGAKYMETLDTEQVKTDLMKRLQQFRPNLPDPINILITKWSSNENTLGSYSYQTVNSAKAGVGPRNLAKPVGDGYVLFAGEATNEKHFSTVHGAIESGWREADRIICSLTKE